MGIVSKVNRLMWWKVPKLLNSRDRNWTLQPSSCETRGHCLQECVVCLSNSLTIRVWFPSMATRWNTVWYGTFTLASKGGIMTEWIIFLVMSVPRNSWMETSVVVSGVSADCSTRRASHTISVRKRSDGNSLCLCFIIRFPAQLPTWNVVLVFVLDERWCMASYLHCWLLSSLRHRTTGKAYIANGDIGNDIPVISNLWEVVVSWHNGGHLPEHLDALSNADVGPQNQWRAMCDGVQLPHPTDVDVCGEGPIIFVHPWNQHEG